MRFNLKILNTTLISNLHRREFSQYENITFNSTGSNKEGDDANTGLNEMQNLRDTFDLLDTSETTKSRFVIWW